METVLFVVHLMVVFTLIVMVLLQRTEGGALGIGGGGGGGGMMSSRAAGDIMTKITTGLALCFFLTSIGIAILAQTQTSPDAILDGIVQSTEGGSNGTNGVLDALPGTLEGTTPAAPSEPQVPTGN